MLFLRIRHFLIFMIVILTLFLTGAVTGYLAFMESGNKFQAEQLLFYGIIVLMVFLIFAIRILVFGKQAVGKLDKILDLVTQQGVLPLERLKYFGTLGSKMQNLYSELNALGKRKSSRIQQQNVTINKLLEFIGIPLLIVDVTGEIRKASGGFAVKNRMLAAEAAGKRLHEFIEELNFHAVLLEANRTKSAVQVQKEKAPVTFYPILSSRNDVAYFITVFGQHELFLYSNSTEEIQKKPVSSRPARKYLLGNFLDRIKKTVRRSGDADKE